ncbi:MAG: extracellular solute-binding protein [Candidatus Lokiarchaeota archaeon]|nr:extracellular solute-binding protein [Candidatus Lokiarchaeota archaeon]
MHKLNNFFLIPKFIKMFNFKKATIYPVILSILFNFGLTGCRKKEAPPPQESYEGIELTYYKVFDDSDIIEPMIAQYEADHPGLEIHYKKFSDFNEYQRTILNEMAEGEGPDIFSMQNTWFTSNYRKLMPMPETLGDPSAFEATFVNVAYDDLVRTDENGIESVYGLPMTVDTLALYYNENHFEDRIPERGRPSNTWEGIKEDVVLLNKEDNSFDRFEVSGIAMGRADNIDRAVDILYLLFLQYGVDFYNENISEAIFAGQQGGEFAYPALEALDFYTGFADPDQKHYSWNEFTADDDSEYKEIESFAGGDVSMIIGYAYTYDIILEAIDSLDSKGFKTIDKDSIRIASVPQLYDPAVSSEKRVTYASYFAETVSRTTEYPDLAWDFLIFMTSKENLDYYFEKTNNPTSRRDMIQDQEKDPIYGVFASQIGYAESFPILDYYTYKDIFSEVVSRANIEGTARSDLVYAQDQINLMIPEEGILVPEAEIEETEEEKTEEDEE